MWYEQEGGNESALRSVWSYVGERYLGQSVCLAIRTSEVVGLLLFIEPRGKRRCSFLASHETRCKTTAQHQYSDPQKELCKVCPEKDRQRAKFE